MRIEKLSMKNGKKEIFLHPMAGLVQNENIFNGVNLSVLTLLEIRTLLILELMSNINMEK